MQGRALWLKLTLVGVCSTLAANAHGAGLLIGDAWSPSSRVSVEGEVTDAGASLTVTREYSVAYDLEEAVSARWYHALPAGAELVGLRINDAELAGDVLAVQEADGRRRQLVETVREPGPLASTGQRLFVSEAFDAQPGAYLRVEFEYTAELAPRDTMQGVDIALDWSNRPIGTVTTSIRYLSEGSLRAVYSPTHELTTVRVGTGEVLASHSSYSVPSAVPLTLLHSVSDDPIRLDLLPYRDGVEGSVVALLTADPEPNEDNVVPRDLVFVVDTSGSMEGEKMAQAREAITTVLGGLRPEDSINIVSFDTVVEVLSDSAQLASSSAIADAIAFTQGLTADGGTNIYDSLETGFRTLPTRTGNPRYLVFLTDGQATEGETNTELILAMAERQNEVGARVFAFGVGNDVNTWLLDRLTENSGGDAFYIRPGQSVATAVETFFDSIAAPVLSDPTLDLTAFGITDVLPDSVPDLFAGQTVTLVGRYSQPGSGQIVLRGNNAAGAVAYLFDVTLPSLALRNGQVPRIWAARELGGILQQIKLGDDDQQLKDRALALADRYGVVTTFTFYRVDDEGDARMVWSDVPMDVDGDLAVGTSEAIDDVRRSGAAVGEGSDHLRYGADRALPLQDGYFTDSSISPESDWVDVHFASDAYFELLQDELALGIAHFLPLGRSLRFEFRGRPLRITDVLGLGEEVVPPTPTAVPVAEPNTPSEEAVVLAIPAPGDVPFFEWDDPLANPNGTPLPTPEAGGEEAFANGTPAGCGCSATQSPTASLPHAVLVLGLFVLVSRRRRAQ